MRSICVGTLTVYSLIILCGCIPAPKGVDLVLIKLASMDDEALITNLLAETMSADNQALKERQLFRAEQIQVSIAKTLLNMGGHVDVRNKEGQTPLILASKKDRGYLASLLLLNGARIEVRDVHERTAYEYASAKKNADITGLLSAAKSIRFRKFDVNQQLLWACGSDSASVVSFLLDKGGDPNWERISESPGLYNRPILSASEHCRAETIQLLLSKGADIQVTNGYGETALHIAVDSAFCFSEKERYMGTIRVLLMHGANPNAMDYRGRTALYIAANRGPHRCEDAKIYLETIRILLESGADPNFMITIQDGENSRTNCPPLFETVYHADFSASATLLAYGADPNINCPYEGTAIRSAVFNDHKEIVALLIDYGADVTVLSLSGRSLLECTEDPEILSMLVSRGADINYRYADGRTPLMNAAAKNNIKLVKTYLDLGADPSLVDASGKTALRLSEDSEIKTMLRAISAKRKKHPVGGQATLTEGVE